jgi:hypothetical protein
MQTDCFQTYSINVLQTNLFPATNDEFYTNLLFDTISYVDGGKLQGEQC